MSTEPESSASAEEQEPELSPRAARIMRIVLWTVVAVMAAGWIFLFYNVISRSLAPPQPPPPPVKVAATPKPPAAAAAAVAPAGKPATQPSIAMDVPTGGSTLQQPFVVSGWAVDRGASVGTGVDAVAVWAIPLAGGENKLLGLAQYGARRPDLAPVLGDRFVDSAYTMQVTGLPPGQYRIAAFLHSTVTGEFSHAHAVDVTVR